MAIGLPRKSIIWGGGHGEEHAAGYYIEVETAEEEAEDEEEVDFAELVAMADTGKGAKVFGKCKACHKLEDGANGTGPHLYQVVDRDVAAADGYGYSGALIEVADVVDNRKSERVFGKPKIICSWHQNGFCGS